MPSELKIVSQYFKTLELHKCDPENVPICQKGFCNDLYDILHDRAYGKSMMRINENDKVDILQESYSAVHCGIGRKTFNDKIEFQKWVNVIISNKITDYKRKKIREKIIISTDDEIFNEGEILNDRRGYLSEYDLTIGSLEANDFLENINKELIRRGNHECSELFTFYYNNYNTLTQEEMAEIYEINYAAFKKRLQRCREEIRRIIKDWL